MKTMAEIKKKLYCLKPDHMEESIDYICDDTICKDGKLCCYICQ
jgi:hypothetical protein